MPDLFVLVGLPGSGKSTWRKKFLDSAPNADQWVEISSDDIIEEESRKVGCSYAEGFKRFSNYASKELKRRARQAVNEGKNIIWDQTNMSPKARKTALKICEGYNAEAVVFSIPDTVLHERLRNRPDKEIPDYVIKSMAQRYQAPTKDEGFSAIKYVRE